jgi:D-methionine transport system permease protein
MFDIIGLIDINTLLNNWLGENSGCPRHIICYWETIYMVVISTAISYIFGLPLAVILVTSDEGKSWRM